MEAGKCCAPAQHSQCYSSCSGKCRWPDTGLADISLLPLPSSQGCSAATIWCCHAAHNLLQIFQCHYLRYVYALFEDDDPPKYILDAGATRGPLVCLTCALSAVRSQLVAQSRKRHADRSSRLLIWATLQIACYLYARRCRCQRGHVDITVQVAVA